MRCAWCAKPILVEPIEHQTLGEVMYFDTRNCLTTYRKLHSVYGDTFLDEEGKPRAPTAQSVTVEVSEPEKGKPSDPAPIAKSADSREAFDSFTEDNNLRSCIFCGKPLLRDKLTGTVYCSGCEVIISRLPGRRSYMLYGESGTGKSVFLSKIIDLYLRNSRPCIFVALDEQPGRLRASMKSFVERLGEHEEKGLLSFVDCYSCLGGLKSPEKYSISRAGDVNELNLLIKNLVSGLGADAQVNVVLDSATAMFVQCETDLVMKFLYSLSAKLKASGGSLFFTLGTGAVSDEVQKKLEQLADGLVEFRTTESQGRTIRSYRVSKVRGTMYFDTWLPFFIGSKGIQLGAPEDPATQERFLQILKLIGSEG